MLFAIRCEINQSVFEEQKCAFASQTGESSWAEKTEQRTEQEQ